MEVHLLSTHGLPEDCVLSIRGGSVRRQGPADSGRVFRFPKLGMEENPLRVDVFKEVATGHVVLVPGVTQHRVAFPFGMSCEVEVRPTDNAEDTADADVAADQARTGTGSARDARDYLERHQILPFIQALLQTVVKERPSDPYKYMARHFMSGYEPSDPSAVAGITPQEAVSGQPHGQQLSACENADWVRLGGAELEEPLRKGWIKLVRADWLIAHEARGGILARREDMPPSAYVSVDELKQAGAGGCGTGAGKMEWLRVLMLSYPWLQPDHPDPHGESLRLLVECLRVYVDDGKNAGKPYGVLIDFPSLFQTPRSNEEQEVFARASQALAVFYSHPATVMLKITQIPKGYPHGGDFYYTLPEGANIVDYAERGWCFAESSMSGLAKPSSLVLSLRHDGEFFAKSLSELIQMHKAGRAPPLHVAEFSLELSKKTFTSKKAELDKVNKLYSDVFERRLASAVELDFSGLGWGAREVQQLSRALQSTVAPLQSLNLSENSPWGEQGAAGLVGVTRSSTLSTLNVAGSKIGDPGSFVIAKLLARSFSLQTLQLERNMIEDKGGSALGKALEGNHSLQTLDLRCNRIGDHGTIALGKALEKNSTLQTLDLGANACGRDGAVALGKALESNRSLGALSLHCNNIGDNGTVALGKALEKNSTLQTLDLGKNACGRDGAVALGKALEGNHSLWALSLRGNKNPGMGIGDAGIVALGKALEKNSTLQTLDLGANSCGAGGAVALGKALESNHSLRSLNLEDNFIGIEGMPALGGSYCGDGAVVLGKALESNHSLQSLNLENNNIGIKGKTALRKALEQSETLQTLVL